MQPEVMGNHSPEMLTSRREKPQSRNAEALQGRWKFAIGCGSGKGLGTLG